MYKLKTKKANVVTYARPSVKAIPVHHYGQAGKELVVYPFIDGWFELRTGNDSTAGAEFIRKEDLRFDLDYRVKASVKFLITTLKQKAKFLKQIKLSR